MHKYFLNEGKKKHVVILNTATLILMFRLKEQLLKS